MKQRVFGGGPTRMITGHRTGGGAIFRREKEGEDITKLEKRSKK